MSAVARVWARRKWPQVPVYRPPSERCCPSRSEDTPEGTKSTEQYIRGTSCLMRYARNRTSAIFATPRRDMPCSLTFAIISTHNSQLIFVPARSTPLTLRQRLWHSTDCRFPSPVLRATYYILARHRPESAKSQPPVASAESPDSSHFIRRIRLHCAQAPHSLRHAPARIVGSRLSHRLPFSPPSYRGPSRPLFGPRGHGHGRVPVPRAQAKLPPSQA